MVLDKIMGVMEFENVSFSYGEITAIRDFTYSFDYGKTYCINGPNGCGKSSIFRIMTGLSFPDRGRYFFDGEEITEKKMKKTDFMRKFHSKQGFLFQNSEVQLFTSSVEDEILFGPVQMGLSEDECISRADKYIHMLHLDNLRKRAPFNLSGGEKKRVALAAILAMEPKVIIMDEPLSGLDEDTQNWITHHIKMLKSDDRLIILSSHDKIFTEAVADVEIRITKEHTLEKTESTQKKI